MYQRGIDLKILISEEVLRNFIISELDGDRDLFERLYGQFSRHLEEFNSAKCEPAVLVPLAHKIRSGCHSLGAGPLEKKLSEIENMGNAINMADLVVLYGDAKLLTGPTLECLANLADDIFKEIKKSA